MSSFHFFNNNMLLTLLLLLPTLSWGSTRSERFPSVEERIKLYASNWYEPPCNSKKKSFYPWYHQGNGDTQTLHVSNITFGLDIIPDQVFYLTEDILRDCARDIDENVTLEELPTSKHIQFRHNMRMYCFDSVEMVDLVNHHLAASSTSNPNIPILIQFGDMKSSHIYGMVELPHFKKFRSAAASPQALKKAVGSCRHDEGLDTVHTGLDVGPAMQPIIWKLATHRHYRQVPLVFRHDTPWEEKEDVAIFRGQLTGALKVYDKKKTDLENCHNMWRCRLVLESHKDKYVDAKLTTTRNRLPASIDGVELVGPTITIRDMMHNKAIIMLEGNDVASGLKWALLSQSVVLMPPPKHTSWCMEELLEEWVHYIPLKEDASDAGEKMKWIVEHDKEARAIAQRGTLWMEDLLFHPNAAREERLIKEELLRIYFAHFQQAPAPKVKKDKSVAKSKLRKKKRH
jgi:hypothetical protein